MIREAAETYNWSVYREEVVEGPTIEGLSVSPLRRLREHCGRRRGQSQSKSGSGGEFLEHSSSYDHLHKTGWSIPCHGRGSGCGAPPLAEDLCIVSG